MKKVCVVGHFAEGQELLNGQTIKTKIITKEIVSILGNDQVKTIDTHGGIRVLVRLPFQLFLAMNTCENIFIFPAHNGVRIIVPIINTLNRFFRRNTYYVVIGGWLPDLLNRKKSMRIQLNKLTKIYVETSTINNKLNNQGLTNVQVLPNCKDFQVLKKNELEYNLAEPFKVCTFSRVMQEKGIEDAIHAVIKINEHYGRIVYCLDIYGQIEPNETEWFANIASRFPSYINYKGSISFDKSSDVLKSYFALLFPTRFYTEGIPGTVIDAYAAGVPVVSSMWESFADVIDAGETGIGYEFGSNDELYSVLLYLSSSPERLNNMKINCLKKAEKYESKTVVKNLIDFSVRNC